MDSNKPINVGSKKGFKIESKNDTSDLKDFKDDIVGSDFKISLLENNFKPHVKKHTTNKLLELDENKNVVSRKRRRHKNSRFGCEECKTRKIKCDSKPKVLTGGVYTCLNCLLKWKRIAEINKNNNIQIINNKTASGLDFQPFCSFSSLSKIQIENLLKEMKEKDLVYFSQLNNQNLFPINQVQHCCNLSEAIPPEKVKIQKLFEVTMIPHKKISIPQFAVKSRLIENNDQVNQRQNNLKFYLTALNFVNVKTISYYTSFALNAYIAKLRKMYLKELKGIDAVYGTEKIISCNHSDYMISNACFNENRSFFEKNLDIFSKVSNFDEKKNMILKFIANAEKLLTIKLSLSYEAIGSLINSLVSRRIEMSPALLFNCHIGSYLLRRFELYSLVTDKNAMNRYIEHYCSSLDISWNLIHMNLEDEKYNKDCTNVIHNHFSNHLHNTGDANFLFTDLDSKWKHDNIECLLSENIEFCGDKIGYASLFNAAKYQTYLHFNCYSIDFFLELTDMLNEFGNLFILSLPDNKVDSILKEDFKNLVLFLEQTMKTSVFIDWDKAFPLQPNLIWQLIYKLQSIRPTKLLTVVTNEFMCIETIDKICKKHKILNDSYFKFSQKEMVNDCNKLGLVTPVERVLYKFYCLVDISLANCFPSILYVYGRESFGDLMSNECTFETFTKDLDFFLEVDQKLLFFCNYTFRTYSYMHKRKTSMVNYTCLNSFYEPYSNANINLLPSIQQLNALYLHQPCYKSRIAYNLVEHQVDCFLKTRIKKANYFLIDDSKPIPLELMIGFSECHQKLQNNPFYGPHVMKNGHYWDGNFYMILNERYITYSKNLHYLTNLYGNAFKFYFSIFRQKYKSNKKFETYFQDFSKHSINKLALKGISGSYKYQEIVLKVIDFEQLERALQNLVTFEQKYNETGDLKKAEFLFHNRNLVPIVAENDNCSSTISSCSTQKSIVSTAVDLKKSFCSLKKNNLPMNIAFNQDVISVLNEHKVSKLSELTGLFELDYDLILEKNAQDYFSEQKILETKRIKERKEKQKKKIDSLEEPKKKKELEKIGLLDLLPGLDFIRIVRQDKLTLLFDDGRDN
ncbi:hypothetical protein QEN19_001727 [Hanseniaspora menglaensis]